MIYWFYLHLTTVTLSSLLFITRWLYKCYSGKRPKHFVLSRLPHLIDSLLLLSAVMLAVNMRQIPFIVSWITVKVLAVILYILLGIFAMRAKTKKSTLILGIAALIVLAYIFLVAITKQYLLFTV